MVRRMIHRRRPKRRRHAKRFFRKKNYQRKAGYVSGTLLNRVNNMALMPRRFITTCQLNCTGYLNKATRAQVAYSVIVNANTITVPVSKTVTTLGDADIYVLNSSQTTFNINPAGLFTLLGAGSFYQNYRVYACAVTVNALPQAPQDDLYVCMAPITFPNPGALYTDPLQMTSLGLGRGPLPVQYYSTTQYRTLKGFYSIHKVAGLSKDAIMDNPAYSGAVSSNPLSQVAIQVFIYTMSGAAFTSNPNLQIKMKWYLEFFNNNESTIPI